MIFLSRERFTLLMCAFFYLHLKVNENLSKRKFNSHQHWLYLFSFLYICSKLTRKMKALLLQCTFLTTLCLASQCIAANPIDNSKYLPVSKILRNCLFFVIVFFYFYFLSILRVLKKIPQILKWLSSFLYKIVKLRGNGKLKWLKIS